MFIMDAIKSQSNPNAILFLVTSYVESLQHSRRAHEVPDVLMQLPVVDEADLHVRLRALDAVPPVTRESRAIAREASAVFASALRRLADVEPANHS